jgi:hypothetical protein
VTKAGEKRSSVRTLRRMVKQQNPRPRDHTDAANDIAPGPLSDYLEELLPHGLREKHPGLDDRSFCAIDDARRGEAGGEAGLGGAAGGRKTRQGTAKNVRTLPIMESPGASTSRGWASAVDPVERGSSTKHTVSPSVKPHISTVLHKE